MSNLSTVLKQNALEATRDEREQIKEDIANASKCGHLHHFSGPLLPATICWLRNEGVSVYIDEVEGYTITKLSWPF